MRPPGFIPKRVQVHDFHTQKINFFRNIASPRGLTSSEVHLYRSQRAGDSDEPTNYTKSEPFIRATL